MYHLFFDKHKGKLFAKSIRLRHWFCRYCRYVDTVATASESPIQLTDISIPLPPHRQELLPVSIFDQGGNCWATLVQYSILLAALPQYSPSRTLSRISSHFCLPINTEALPFSTSSRKPLKLIRFCCWWCIQIETSVTSLRLIFETLGWSVLSECLQLNLLIWRRASKLILLKTRHMHWHFSSLQICLFSSTVDMTRIHCYIIAIDFFKND